MWNFKKEYNNILYNQDYYIEENNKIKSLNLTRKSLSIINKSNNIFQVYFYNYLDGKPFYYLLTNKYEILIKGKEKFSFYNYYWIGNGKAIIDLNKLLVNDVIGECNSILFIKNRSSINYMCNKYGEKINEIEISPNLFINIKDNKYGVYRKINNLKEIVVEYGKYNFIGIISEEYLLVTKKNKHNINDERMIHWPQIPYFIQSVIDINGKNVLNDAFYRKIDIVDKNIVRLYTGYQLNKWVDLNLKTGKIIRNYTEPNKFKFPNTEENFYYLTFCSDNGKYVNYGNYYICELIEEVSVANYLRSCCLIDVKNAKKLSDEFAYVEYTDNNYWIIYDDKYSYFFLSKIGEFQYAQEYYNNYKVKIINNTWYLYNKDKNITNDKEYECIYPNNTQIDNFIVKNKNMYGVINFEGKEIIPCKYSEIKFLKYNYILCKEEAKNSLFNLKGQFLYNNKNISDELICTKYIIVFEKNDKGVYQINNEKLILDILDQETCNEYKNKYSDFQFLYGTIYELRERNTLKLIKIYTKINHFTNGLAVVSDGDKYGYINEKGEEVIKCQFDMAYDFDNKFAVVKIGNKYSIIDNPCSK